MISRIEHLGIVVDDLDEAVRFLAEAFGLRVERSLDLPERKVHARFLRWGDISIEVVEFGDSKLREVRLGGATARLDHIAVQVENLDEAIDALGKRGVRAATPAPTVVGGRRTVFLAPESAGGLSYQLVDGLADGDEFA